MDKELTEITPTNLDGTEVVNTVKKATEEEAKAAAIAEKEKKENYYVDPLEQDALMKEKLEKIEAEREKRRKENGEYEEQESTDFIDETIRPDMNVNGYFSTGNTASKTSVLKRPASKGTLSFCMVAGIVSAIYSAFYLVILVTDNFASPYWFAGWLYAVAVIISIIVVLTGVRSLSVKNDNLKRKALIGIIGAALSVFPLIAWIIHWITQSL
jgi:hypothetical protein